MHRCFDGIQFLLDVSVFNPLMKQEIFDTRSSIKTLHNEYDASYN